MVLGGKINREIVELVQQAGGRAIGLTGSDGGMLRVKRKLQRRPRSRPRGRVGRGRSRVDASPRRTPASFPVIAPIGVDDEGHHLQRERRRSGGRDRGRARGREADPAHRRRGRARRARAADPASSRSPTRGKLIADGTIKGGMIPKIECCIDALDGRRRDAPTSSTVACGTRSCSRSSRDGGVGTLIAR